MAAQAAAGREGAHRGPEPAQGKRGGKAGRKESRKEGFNVWYHAAMDFDLISLLHIRTNTGPAGGQGDGGADPVAD